MKNTRQELTFEEMKEQFKDMPTDTCDYFINGIFYTVVSHFVGTKDADDILVKNAYNSAYADVFAPINAEDEEPENLN